MIEVIIGGSASGKSEYAEKLAMTFNEKRYYLATMEAFDEEGKKRIAKHRKNREGKGFITLEKSRDIGNIDKYFGIDLADSTVLLECMTNLVANEMFNGSEALSIEATVKKVLKDIKELENKSKRLVIVTGNVFEDGASYDEHTMNYICAMGKINAALAKMAVSLTELVAGIAIKVKSDNGRLDGSLIERNNTCI